MKTLFIYNPHAGMTKIKNHLYNIINILSNADCDLTVYPTKKQGDATRYIIENINKYDLLICSGGDGTLNETINGLMNSGLNDLPKLGYIPAGSANDFANSLKLPKSMESCASLITKKQAKAYDIGLFDNKYFVYIAAFGAFTKVSYNTPQNVKNTFGHLAYIVEGIKSLSEIIPYKLKINYDGNILEDKFIYGMITNTLQVGGIYKLNPKDVKLDDGIFELLLVKEPKDVTQFNEITSYLLGKINETDLVVSLKASNITIESKEKLSWTLDGEYGGIYNKVNITNIHKAINIIGK